MHLFKKGELLFLVYVMRDREAGERKKSVFALFSDEQLLKRGCGERWLRR